MKPTLQPGLRHSAKCSRRGIDFMGGGAVAAATGKRLAAKAGKAGLA